MYVQKYVKLSCDHGDSLFFFFFEETQNISDWIGISLAANGRLDFAEWERCQPEILNMK